MGLKIPEKNWWETQSYELEDVLPPALMDPQYWGPNGAALVKAYENGSTQQGWGLNPPKLSTDGFMPRYKRGEFLPRRTLYTYEKGQHAAAIVMRSARMMCVDIDGKNGGLENAGALGALPVTTAEVSKSGNGYHLWYLTDEDWDAEMGFDLIHDQIGIVQGVDIKGVGCVYHYPQQRWNNVAPVLMPEYLLEKLLEKKQHRLSQMAAAANIANLDETERLIMHDELLTDLAKPIAGGKRNNTLFAIGQRMKAAQVPDWQGHIRTRAGQLGLDYNETEKLVDNITTYV